MTLSFRGRILVFGLGLIALGFTHWTFEESVNSVIPQVIEGFTGHPYEKKIIDTWVVIQWEFIAGGIITAIAILLYIFF